MCVCLLAQVIPRVLGASVPRRCDLAADDAAAAAALGRSVAGEPSSKHMDNDEDDDHAEGCLLGTLVSIGRRSHGPNRGAVGIGGAGAGGPDGDTGGGGDGELLDGDIRPSIPRILGPWGLGAAFGAIISSNQSRPVSGTGLASCCMQLASLLAKESVSIVGDLAGGNRAGFVERGNWSGVRLRGS